MTSTTDAMLDTTAGLLGVAIMANVAGNILNPRRKKAKKTTSTKRNSSYW